MRYRFEAVVDLDAGRYDVEFANLTNPEAGVTYGELKVALQEVFNDIEHRMEEETSGSSGKPPAIETIHFH